MSQKNQRKSSISTLNASARSNKVRSIQQMPVTFSTVISPTQIVNLPDSDSPAIRAFADPDARLAWDNGVRFQIARNLLKLRNFRGWSQIRLAKAAGTSQPAIARIENEIDNMTADTLERLIGALGGRFRVSIAPAELELPSWGDWWDIVDTCVVTTSPQTLRRFGAKTAGSKLHVMAEWTCDVTTPNMPQALPAQPVRQRLLATAATY